MAATSRSVDIRATEIADDDPFAELTRIMGHDPRSAQPENAVELSEDDLSIDLENELLGGMWGFDGVEEPAPEQNETAMGAEPSDAGTPGAEGQTAEMGTGMDAGLPRGLDDDLMAAFEAEFQDGQEDGQSVADDSHAPVTKTSSDVAKDHEIDPVFDTFNAGGSAHSYLDDAGPADAWPFVVTGTAAPLPAALATRLSFSGRVASVDKIADTVDRPVAPDPAADDAVGPETDMASTPIDDDHSALRDNSAPQTFGNFKSAEISRAPAFDPLDVQQASDFSHGAVEAGAVSSCEMADTNAGENTAFDYRKAASDRHEFLEEALAGETPPAAPLRETASPDDDVFSRADEYSERENTDAALEGVAESSLFAQPEDGRGSGEAPQIETVEISEKPSAIVDDLNIPEPEAVVDEAHAALVFDDLAEELAGAFGNMEDETGPQEGRDHAAPAADTLEDAVYDDQAAAAGQAGRNVDPALAGVSADYDPDIHQDFGVWSAGDGEDEDIAYDDDARAAPLSGYEGRKSRSSRRGVIVAALLTGAAVIGGVGVFAFSSGDMISSGKPALVKADNEPFKVKPKTTGGDDSERAQNNEVYQRASGVRTVGAPEQAKLVTTAEEPIDLQEQIAPRMVDASASSAEDDAVVAKAEDRLSTASQQNAAAASEPEPISVQPHRVKTFIVKPDGTLVPREEAALKPAKEASASDAMMSDTAGDSGISDDPATGSTGADAAATSGDSQPAGDSAAVPTPAARPAERPKVASAGTSKPAKKALAPAAAAAPAGPLSDWSVQISSQPSVESAQQSYRNMASNYSDVLQGRGVNIVKADIAGKGTYYRVRIPTTSKDDAISLCSKLKSSGGNCFVSK